MTVPRKRRRKRMGFVGSSVFVVLSLSGFVVRITEAYKSPSSRNFLALSPRIRPAVKQHDDGSNNSNQGRRRSRATATEEAVVDVTDVTTIMDDDNNNELFDLPPWLSHHKHSDKSTTEARVKELEFALLEKGFTPMDIRDIALTLQAASKGDGLKLSGMVDFLNLILSFSDNKAGDANSFATKEVLQASVLHFGDCVTARQTGVYDMVREAVFRTDLTGSSEYRMLGPSSKRNRQNNVHEFISTSHTGESNFYEVLQTEDTGKASSLVLVNGGSRFSDHAAVDIARGAARVKRAEVLASTILGSEGSGKRRRRSLKEDEASRLRGLLLSVMDDWRALGIRVIASLYRLQGLLEARRKGTDYSEQTAVAKHAAREALRIYAPLAQRLGMQRLKAKLEDSAFQLLYKRQYRAASYLYAGSGQAMKAVTRYLEQQVSAKLFSNELLMEQLESLSVISRVKEPYSAWKKLLRQRYMLTKKKAPAVAVDVESDSSQTTSSVMPLSRLNRREQLSLYDIHDSMALRVILKAKKLTPDEPEETTRGRERILCYVVQRMIRDDWPVIDSSRIKDYIQRPKPNGYQSLHYTASISSQGLSLPFEVQVRSDEMHRIAEYGVAAHWDYKLKPKENAAAAASLPPADASNASVLAVPQQQQQLSYLDALEVAKENLVQNQVFVFFAGTSSASAMDGTGQLLSLSTGASVKDAICALQEQLDVSRDMTLDNDDDYDSLDGLSNKISKNGRPTSLDDTVENGDVLLIRL